MLRQQPGDKAGAGGENQGELADLDSNQDKQNQNLLCYHYTIGQEKSALLSVADLVIVCFCIGKFDARRRNG